MRNFCSLVTLAALAAMPVLAQAYRAPRMADGHPNFNGIWQAMNTANWDIQDHSAAPATMWQTGSIGAVPAGAGVVVQPAKVPVSKSPLTTKLAKVEAAVARSKSPIARKQLPMKVFIEAS